MEILVEGDRGYVYNGRFTGPVQLEMVFEAGEPAAEVANLADADIAKIHHEDGAVTNWHSHPGGQILMLIAGRARIGNADGTTTEILPGTCVRTAPGEAHWHGADAGETCTWLGITWGVTDWTDDNPLEGESRS